MTGTVTGTAHPGGATIDVDTHGLEDLGGTTSVSGRVLEAGVTGGLAKPLPSTSLEVEARDDLTTVSAPSAR